MVWDFWTINQFVYPEKKLASRSGGLFVPKETKINKPWWEDNATAKLIDYIWLDMFQQNNKRIKDFQTFSWDRRNHLTKLIAYEITPHQAPNQWLGLLCVPLCVSTPSNSFKTKMALGCFGTFDAIVLELLKSFLPAVFQPLQGRANGVSAWFSRCTFS